MPMILFLPHFKFQVIILPSWLLIHCFSHLILFSLHYLSVLLSSRFQSWPDILGLGICNLTFHSWKFFPCSVGLLTKSLVIFLSVSEKFRFFFAFFIFLYDFFVFGMYSCHVSNQLQELNETYQFTTSRVILSKEWHNPFLFKLFLIFRSSFNSFCHCWYLINWKENSLGIWL